MHDVAEVSSQLAFGGILHSVFEHNNRDLGICIGFTSATAKEGVSYVTRKIADQLREEMADSVLLVTAAQFRDPAWLRTENVVVRSARDRTFNGNSPAERWREKIMILRSRFRYTIIDCSAFTISNDALALAPHLDGIVIVVEANATSKKQVAQVERQLRLVNGKLLGFVLNKRRYLLPQWLFKFLQ